MAPAGRPDEAAYAKFRPVEPIVEANAPGGDPGQLVTAFEAGPDQSSETGAAPALGLPDGEVADPPRLLRPPSGRPQRMGTAEGTA